MKMKPTYEDAIKNGVEDNTYRAVGYGWVLSYSGEAIITMPDGSKWKAIGHRPKGDAWSIYREGYIEFIPISES